MTALLPFIPVLAQVVFELDKLDVTTLLVRRRFSASVLVGALGSVIVYTEVFVTDAIVWTLLYLLASELAFSDPVIEIF